MTVILKKTCSYCDIRKTIKDFSIRRSRHGKLYVVAQCKACIVLKTKEWALRNPEKNLILHKKKYHRNKGAYKLLKVKTCLKCRLSKKCKANRRICQDCRNRDQQIYYSSHRDQFRKGYYRNVYGEDYVEIAESNFKLKKTINPDYRRSKYEKDK